MRTLVPAGRQDRAVASDDLFQFGIEEEYFLSDVETLQVPSETPDALFHDADFCIAGHIGREFLRAQIEVATEPHCSAGEVRVELLRLRQNAAAAAARHRLAVLACGTHPLASWRDSVQSPKQRYDKVMDDLQMIGRRNMLCGMHVHVEFPNPTRRVSVMTRMLPYVPLFIALSTSSAFWQGRATGLKGYRLAAYDELPCTGLPELFRTNAEYDAYVAAMVDSGAMPDSSSFMVGDPAVAEISDAGAASPGLLRIAAPVLTTRSRSRHSIVPWCAICTPTPSTMPGSTSSTGRSPLRISGAPSVTAPKAPS